MRKAWVGLLWLAACATGSSSEGDDGVESLMPGGPTTTTTTPMTNVGESASSATIAEGEETADHGSSGAPAPECGNAVVELGEQCDDGDDDPCNGCEACQRRSFLVLDGGRSQAVEIADVAEAPLALLDTSLTVEAWVRLDEADHDVQIIRRGAGNSGWRLGLRPGQMIATVFSGFDHVFEGVPPVGSGWHHIAWTYDRVTSRLYLDGILVGELVSTAPVLATDAPLRLGSIVDGTGVVLGPRAGRIDEVRVSTLVRHPGPFVAERRHAPDAATVLLLHLDEGEGESLVDASPHGHAGTALSASWAPGDGYGRCP